MKIFYGVQGTGNGHTSRARVMAKELYAAGIEVKFHFTGRPADKYFDMDIFNDYQVGAGLTFNTRNGQVNYLKTALEAKPISFIREVKALDLSGYDLIISDFEPVTSWAAKNQKKMVLGISHQYAFNYKIPRAGADPIAEQIMKYFAPVDIGVGLHWHHFGQPILPPIIDTMDTRKRVVGNKIIVYLPFEDPNKVINLLAPFANFRFHLYSPVAVSSQFEHIKYHPLSRIGFQQDLSDSGGIICNSGFELASESLQLGKKILAKPQHAQMEQISNAAALEQLGYGQVMADLDGSIVEKWLHNGNAVQISYPNIARILVQWIADGMPPIDTDFIEAVWNRVKVQKITH